AISAETTRAKAAEATAVSGTLGVIEANEDEVVTGLHINGATGRPSVVHTSGSADIAWESDVTSEASTRESADSALSTAITNEVTRAKAAEATAVSGTLGVIADNGDKPGTGLHLNGSTGNASFTSSEGSFDLASQSSLTSEASTRASADATLSSAITTEVARAKAAEADLVSGTLGVIAASGDKQGTGLHLSGETGNASFEYDGGSFDLASQSSLTSEASTRASADSALSSSISAETTRAKAAEADLVSGTLGVVSDNGDLQGTGLHYRGATGNASFEYDGGSFDLASYATATAMPTLYTSSTTLTVGSGKSVAVIQAVGGGGSGCSVKGTSIANSTYGAGGAAGGYVHFHISVSSGDTIGITVGAGASSPTNTINGQTNGGDTIVTLNGTEVARASGGTGGVWNSVSSCAGGTGGGASTQNGATPIAYSNGTDGGDGQTGAESIASVSGYGAPGVWGGGGRAGNGGGQAGTGFGAGGGGAYDTSYSDTFYGGGAGHDGCVIVEIK
ncbi:glycine-rich domain-containing protein, partial [Gluconobacter aidae]|uniref:glycine-rich domain-containing protein n=1 Tax=Gluconobacter aidae TaxID=2662454 RepID=UPI001885B8D8